MVGNEPAVPSPKATLVLRKTCFDCNYHHVCVSCVCRTGDYKYKRGTTGVLGKVVTPLALEVIEESVHTMDTS